METVRLSREMMPRWEIPDRRPERMENVLFSSEPEMLMAGHLLCGGSLCVTPRAAALNAQDDMFTLLLRSEEKSEEYVEQKLLKAVDPETDFDAFLAHACEKKIVRLALMEDASDVRLALAARFLHARFEAGLPAPEILLISALPEAESADRLLAAITAITAKWSRASEFFAWLSSVKVRSALLDGFFGFMDDAERALQQRKMNYADDFLMWSEPDARLLIDADPEKHARILLSAAALAAAGGWFCGCKGFSDAMRDETLRRWIGRAFTEELLPNLPWSREAISADVISAFERLEDSANCALLLRTPAGKYLLRRLPRTLLPSIRAYADANFEAPPMLSLGVAALVMLYAGARENDGVYMVRRGDESQPLFDDPSILETFARFAHDMPAESLAYAVLADRDLWGSDLREIDGFEARLAVDLSSIQRIGFLATLKNRIGEA